MFEALRVEGFQKHLKLTVSFGPYITTFKGPSEAGKSSLFRALRWLLLNRPTGTNFISWGSKKGVKVQLKVDGRKVTRERFGIKNTYTLNGKSFKAVSGQVPPEVVKLLNVCDENFQWQHAMPFWFSDTAGQVSKALNAIVNLEKIDKALDAIASKRRKAKGHLEDCEDRHKQTRQRERALRWTVKARKDIARIDKARIKAQRIAQDVARLRSLAEDAERYAKRPEPIPDAFMRRGRALAKKLQDLERQVEKLRTLGRQAERLEAEWQRYDTLTHRSELKLKEMARGRCPTCGQTLPSHS